MAERECTRQYATVCDRTQSGRKAKKDETRGLFFQNLLLLFAVQVHKVQSPIFAGISQNYHEFLTQFSFVYLEIMLRLWGLKEVLTEKIVHRYSVLRSSKAHQGTEKLEAQLDASGHRKGHKSCLIRVSACNDFYSVMPAASEKRVLWRSDSNKFVVGGASHIALYELSSDTQPEIRHLTSQHDLQFMKASLIRSFVCCLLILGHSVSHGLLLKLHLISLVSRVILIDKTSLTYLPHTR